jgi:MFS family permease
LLGFARFLIGVGSSTIVVTRTYVSYAAMKEERAMYLHLLASIRLIGLIGGPLFGFMFISVDFSLWNGGPAVDKYSAPALFSAIVGILLCLGILFGFKEFRVHPDELKSQSERENTSASSRDYRVSEVTPLVSGNKERVVHLDKTGFMVGNLMLLVVGATYSVYSVLQPLLMYDNFGWGIRENYIFFAVSMIICLLCCLVMPGILIYFDGRAIVVFSLIASAGGFLGRIHFHGNGEDWKVQFLSVTITLIVTGYTSCSVILFGLFTKALGQGESASTVNIALGFGISFIIVIIIIIYYYYCFWKTRKRDTHNSFHFFFFLFFFFFFSFSFSFFLFFFFVSQHRAGFDSSVGDSSLQY